MKRRLALTSAVGAFASTAFAAPAPTRPDILPIAAGWPAPSHVDSDPRHRLIRHGTGLEKRTSPTNLGVSPNPIDRSLLLNLADPNELKRTYREV